MSKPRTMGAGTAEQRAHDGRTRGHDTVAACTTVADPTDEKKKALGGRLTLKADALGGWIRPDHAQRMGWLCWRKRRGRWMNRIMPSNSADCAGGYAEGAG